MNKYFYILSLIFLTLSCFAFKALVEKSYPKIRNILLAHKNDEDVVQEYSKCIELHTPVKDYMLKQLEPFSESKYRFNRKEYDEVQKDFIEN